MTTAQVQKVLIKDSESQEIVGEMLISRAKLAKYEFEGRVVEQEDGTIIVEL